MLRRASFVSVLILTLAFGGSLQAQQRVGLSDINPLTGKSAPVRATYNPYTGGQHVVGAKRNALTGTVEAVGSPQQLDSARPTLPGRTGAGGRNPYTGASAAPVAQRNPLTGGVHYSNAGKDAY